MPLNQTSQIIKRPYINQLELLTLLRYDRRHKIIQREMTDNLIFVPHSQESLITTSFFK
jgi:hypothetical protein